MNLGLRQCQVLGQYCLGLQGTLRRLHFQWQETLNALESSNTERDKISAQLQALELAKRKDKEEIDALRFRLSSEESRKSGDAHLPSVIASKEGP